MKKQTLRRSMCGTPLAIAGFLAGIAFVVSCGSGGMSAPPAGTAAADDALGGLVVHRTAIPGPHVVPNAATVLLGSRRILREQNEAFAYVAAEVSGADPAKHGEVTLQILSSPLGGPIAFAKRELDAGASGARVLVRLDAYAAPTGPHALDEIYCRVLFGASTGPGSLGGVTIEVGILENVRIVEPSGRFLVDPVTEDTDGDGMTPLEGDCDDGNSNVHPGAMEVANGIDDDCDDEVDEIPGISLQYPDGFQEDAERMILEFARSGDLGGGWQDSTNIAPGACGNAAGIGDGGNDYIFLFGLNAEILNVLPNPDPTYTRTISVTGGPNAVPVDVAIYVLDENGCVASANDVTDPAQINLGETLTYTFDMSKTYHIVVDVAADPNGHQATSIPFQILFTAP